MNLRSALVDDHVAPVIWIGVASQALDGVVAPGTRVQVSH